MKRRYLLHIVLAWTFLSLGCSQGPWNSGDRVLVSKFLHDSEIGKPQRYDVVVFKYPVRPIEKGVPKNYIKRLLGLPGQVLAILFGRLFFMDPEGEAPLFPEPHTLVTKDGKTHKGMIIKASETEVLFQMFDPQKDNMNGRYQEKSFARAEIASLDPIPEAELWKHRLTGDHRDSPANETDAGNDFDFMLQDHPWMYGWYRQGKLSIMRKPPHVMLSMRRIVYDNDFQPKDLVGERFQRWSPKAGTAWKQDSATTYVTDASMDKEVSWLRYRHLVVKGQEEGGPRSGTQDPKVSLITDFYGYNSINSSLNRLRRQTNANWAGDLMLECTLEVTQPQGEFWMEVNRGIDRFRARFDLSTGRCTLFRESSDGKPVELATKDTRVKANGTYQLRFANFSGRLTVWVDRDLPFDDGHDYDPPEVPRRGEFKDLSDGDFKDAIAERRGPTKNDLEPASFGAKGAGVQIKSLRLWRDTYYTRESISGEEALSLEENFNTPLWKDYRKLAPRMYYVQPRHYMCLGDNSSASSDSREWGLVPERLLLGRAHLVYFPFDRAGGIK